MIDLHEVDTLRRQGHTWAQIGERLQHNPEKIRSYWRRQQETRDIREEPEEEPDQLYLEEDDLVLFHDKKRAEEIDWRELVNYARVGKDLADRRSNLQRSANVEIKTNDPIAVVYTGDWHLGEAAVDYKQWVDDISFILNTNKLYMVSLGDDIQNMRSFKTLSAVLSQVLSPPQQIDLMVSITNELCAKRKLLAKVSGNHDSEFDERIFGQAIQKLLLDNMDAPYFPNKGLVNLQVGSQQYTNLLFHKTRFRSILRAAHGAYREWQLTYPAEVVAGAHDHVLGFESFWGYALAEGQGASFGGQTYLIKVGTYSDGEYGWKYFQNGGFPMTQTVVYFPDTHKKLYFDDMRDAVRFIQ